MLTIDQALNRILADVPRMPTEDASLEQACGRILAADVASPRDVPPWDNSAMDGYALIAADTVGGQGSTCDEDGSATGEPVALRVNEVIGAGDWPSTRVEPGTATAIMTGAPMPEGADAVVMVEDTDAAREGHVQVRGKAHPGQHVRRRGGDVRAGDLVLRKGRRITPASVGVAASLGLTALPVACRPKVAILSTGDEVVPPGRPLLPGQIYSSNNHAIAGLVYEAGAIPLDRGNAPDDLDALMVALRGCVDAGADAVVTTGGVSVGAFDFVKDAFARLGGEVDFWKVRMKPGKPLAFGRVSPGGRSVPLFGLPGNPVSCIVNFLQFVRPWLLRSMGAEKPFLPVLEATVAEPLREHGGRANLVRVVLEQAPDGLLCRPTGSQSSGVLTSLVRGHGFALLPPEADGAPAGARVRVQIYDPSFLDREEPGYGW